MKFILNTSLEPHFCALFDDEGALLNQEQWSDFRRDGEIIWNFLDKHQTEDLTFIGGIAGPGGFSSLRASGAILNTLSIKHELKLHQVGAEQVVRQLLNDEDKPDVMVYLNSFSQKVLRLNTKGILEAVELEAARERVEKACVTFLPEGKNKDFQEAVEVDRENLIATTLSILERQKPQSDFVPQYQFPPVQ